MQDNVFQRGCLKNGLIQRLEVNRASELLWTPLLSVIFDLFCTINAPILRFSASRSSSVRCVLLSGGVFRSAVIRDFEAEGVGNIYLGSYKRGDMFCLAGVFHTSD